MPIYEYVCDECQTRYERVVLSASQEIACPRCSSSRHTLQLSVFNARTAAGSADKAEPSGGGFCGCGSGGCGCS